MGRSLFVSLGLLVAAFSLTGASSCCPPDWLSRYGFCYKTFYQPKTWSDAEIICQNHKPGCHLASIHGNEESQSLGEQISNSLPSGENVWIGLNDPQQNRLWEWSDTSCTNYLAWNPGEPNNQKKNESCVQLVASTGFVSWNDQPCDDLRPFICQCKF